MAQKTESKRVYIDLGLDYFIKNNVKKSYSILEMGFGTGLNALLTLEFCQKNNFSIHYTSIEKYPITIEVAKTLHFWENEQQEKDFFLLHSSPFSQKIAFKNVSFLKINQTFQDFSTLEKFDIVYFDAFSYRTQPELWTEEIFKKIGSFLYPEALLTTYSSKSIIRKNLTQAGFRVQKQKGPPGKREVIQAFWTK